MARELGRFEPVGEGRRTGEPRGFIRAAKSHRLRGEKALRGAAHFFDDWIGSLGISHTVDPDNFGAFSAQDARALASAHAVVRNRFGAKSHSDHSRQFRFRFDALETQSRLTKVPEGFADEEIYVR